MGSDSKSIASFMDFAATTLPLPPPKFPRLEKHPYAQGGMQIMHPFLGELGVEVRGFLGQIEPWLRSGWVIAARRPCLYPLNTAFDDPVFFSRIDEIKKEYALFEMAGRLANSNPIPISRDPHKSGTFLHYILSANMKDNVIQLLAAQQEIRQTFFDRYWSENLIPTKWHLQLSCLSHAEDDLYYFAGHAIVPGYVPDLFRNPPFDFQPHVGIQLGNAESDPARNSSPEHLRGMAAQAAKLLNLPVVIYGIPTDDTLPGCARTIDLLPDGAPQLNAELVFLKKCKIMISPDSGWVDLMGWLRVPTILERLRHSLGFETLRPFRPKIMFANEFQNASAEIAALCNCDEDSTILPERHEGDDPRSNFLHPQGSECRQFWKNYSHS